MACFKNSSRSSEQWGFKILPESLSGITTDWYESMLQKQSIISKNTNIIKIDVRKITNEEMGIDDGGGFSGSQLIKLIPKYSGNITGNEPLSMVCKISGNNYWKMPILLRFGDYMSNGCSTEELFSRQEGLFFQRVAPLMKDTLYGLPKIYFVDLNDQGNSNFIQFVILKKPSKVKTVMIMEDLSDYKSLCALSSLSRKQVIACLKNVAILHGKFWKNKEMADIFGFCKTEREVRSTRYSKLAAWKRKLNFSNAEAAKKIIDKFLSTEWMEHSSMKLPKGIPVPDWLTINPSNDGSFVVMEDPMVKEMLSIFANRISNYYQGKLKQFDKKEPQTLLHGDFHSGNHMYATGENEGKVIAVDFQFTGIGMATIDVTTLLLSSWRISNIDEIEDFAKEYHLALIENGVNDYNWLEFRNDLEITIVERLCGFIEFLTMMKATTFFNMFEKMEEPGKQQKAKSFKKLFDSGFFNVIVLYVTCMYVKEKENFLI